MASTQHPSPLGRLLRAAMEHKSAAQGRPYTYRHLARDTGRGFAHLRNIAVGLRRQPDPDVLHDIALALDIDEDRLLIAAGYAPRGLQRAAAELDDLETSTARWQFGGAGEAGGELDAAFQRALDDARAAFQRLVQAYHAPTHPRAER
jgi:transcriptional regulator with XRE-family HTH domain